MTTAVCVSVFVSTLLLAILGLMAGAFILAPAHARGRLLLNWACTGFVLALLLGATVTRAQTVGLHTYTLHEQAPDSHWQNRTPGLYVSGGGYVAGIYRNSFSLPGRWGPGGAQLGSWEVSKYVGKVWTLEQGDGWDVLATVSAVVGYKSNVPATVKLGHVADIVIMPTVSARYGHVRATMLGPRAVSFSLEWNLNHGLQ